MLTVLILLAIPAVATELNGTLTTGSFTSNALGGEEKSYEIYLPPGYENSGVSYPVIYYLGFFFDERPELVEALDAMITSGLLEPVILVKPCGRPSPPPMGRWLDFPDMNYMPNYMDSPVMGAYQAYLVEDVVAHIDTTYRTIADRDHRSACGSSARSQWAMRSALLHPGIFGKVVSFATVLDWRGFEWTCYLAAEEQEFRPIEEYEPTIDDTTDLVLSTAGHYLPNLANPPWYVDYPCTQDGQPIFSLWDFIDAKTARGVAEHLAVSELDLTIGVFAALGDEYGADASAQRFSDVLTAQDAPHTLRIFESTAPSRHDDLRFEMVFSFLHPLNATLELSPRVLNGHNWWPLVEASIELPGDLDVADIDTATLAITQINGEDLDEPLYALVAHDVSDVNGNGRDDLTVWFWKPSLLRLLSELDIGDHEPFDVTVEGETSQGWFLAATDEQRAVHIKSAVAAPWWPMMPAAVVD
jgi:hypothetical protein